MEINSGLWLRENLLLREEMWEAIHFPVESASVKYVTALTLKKCHVRKSKQDMGNEKGFDEAV